MNEKKTLLGRELTPEQKAQQEREYRDWDRVEIFLNAIREGYEQGGIPFERMCKLANEVLACFTGDGLANGVPLKGSDRLLGKMVRTAIESGPIEKIKGTGERSHPDPIKDLAVKLVDLFHEREQAILDREGAFKRVAEWFSRCGYKLTSTQVEEWRRPRE